jgi:hypothetical protein
MDDELHHYYAGLAMLGMIIAQEYAEDIPKLAHALADAMLAKPEGIMAIQKTKKRRQDET